MHFGITALATTALSFVVSSLACAASLDVDVRDANGAAVPDAAVYAEPVSAPPAARIKETEIEQKARKFMPLMTVIQAGTHVAFPNNDTVRHHVYSFSPAKTFELKLYSGTPGNPVLFDKPGTVVIGCNIHDKMIAYIQVVNTPYFGKSGEAGKVRINDLPPGKYKLKAWHHQLVPGAQAPESEITISRQDMTASIALDLKPGSGS